ncbi:MAG: hypothetical protein B0D92_05000 [Spirochaeta sp. LUC14_002_19_P3]|nr:MAG: hypothetical protein B0D92_05000 [Spirochaeta sp. LUC14_002_19_P3]
MRIYDRELKRAYRWLAAGKYTRVIRFLLPKIPSYRQVSSFYAVLGRAYLENGLVSDADFYLKRGLALDPDHLEIRQCLAVNHLKRKDTASAVKAWIEILDDYPEDKISSNGLKALKKLSKPGTQERFLEKFNPRRFLPAMPFVLPNWAPAAVLILIAVITGISLRKPIASILSSIGTGKAKRPGTEIFIQFGKDIAQTDENVLLPMSEEEINRIIKKARHHFDNYEDNSARHELNKILSSNIAESTREEVNGLAKLLAESEFNSLETAYTYKDVASNPKLYEDCWIKWSGVPVNVEFRDDSIAFDFLVGYEDGRVLEGSVPVTVPFLAVMEPLTLELLAKVEVNGSSFRLVAKTLHFQRQ